MDFSTLRTETLRLLFAATYAVSVVVKLPAVGAEDFINRMNPSAQEM